MKTHLPPTDGVPYGADSPSGGPLRKLLVTRRARANREGAALVITLAILVLISIVVVGMATTVRTERGASSSHLERYRAELMTQEATETVVALFNSQTRNARGYWATRPGILVTSPASSDPALPDSQENKKLDSEIPLSSGTSTLSFQPDPPTASQNPAILNAKKLLTPSDNRLLFNPVGTYDPATDSMKLAWVYVRRDGTREWSGTPNTSNSANPIIGRYAYWVDDESSKINYNTASSRVANPGLPIGDPANVSLDAIPNLEPDMAVAIANERAGKLFNSPEDARRIADETAARALQDSKFDVTHYSNTPNLTFFNESKIMLTTQKRHVEAAGGKAQENNSGDGIPYLDILTNSNADPGNINNISASRLTAVIGKLNSYLSRDDWPFVDGRSSFQDKYYTGAAERLAQLSLIIIEYVRAKESAIEVLAPIRGTVDANGDFQLSSSLPTGENAVIGLTRGPRINELGLFVSGAGNVTARIEVHLPLHFGLEEVDLNGWTVWARVISENPDGTVNKNARFGTTGGGLSGSIRAGDYRVFDISLSKDGSQESFADQNGQRSTRFRGRFAISQPNNLRVDVVPLWDDTNANPPFETYIQGPVDSAGVAQSGISSVEVDDPRISTHRGDWKSPVDGVRHTWGRRNSRYLNDPRSRVADTEPQQDTEDGEREGTLSDASLVMPYRAGHPTRNPTGRVTSVGELGFIHTGMKSSKMAGDNWRTLRFQPSDTGTNVVPDWALLDLFTVPPPDGAADKQKLYNPHNATASAGRININAVIEPLWDPEGASLQRISPLVALLKAVPKELSDSNQPALPLDEEEVGIIAGNVFSMGLPTDKRLAAHGKLWGQPHLYDSIGEIVEIEDVADEGEKNEELVRQILGLIATRSNVFTVHAIGQALRQDAGGKLTVTAEDRTQAMIERYSTEVVAPPANPVVKYRTVYNRSLTP